MKYYTGDIQPDKDVVFVFGSNPLGINGNSHKGTGGAALVAQQKFGVLPGEKMDNRFSISGQAYGVMTVTDPGKRRSLLKEDIVNNIKFLYRIAEIMKYKKFMIAYRNTDKASLNGYTGYEMMDMFLEAGPIPNNIYVSEEWYNTGKFNDKLFKHDNNRTNEVSYT